MSNIAVKLPIKFSDSDGYEMVRDYKTLAYQNLKTIILTNPGERVMDSKFGAGVRRFLFEQQSFNQTYLSIDNAIREQVSIYMPGITIKKLDIQQDPKNENKINMKIEFSINAFGSNEILEFTI